MVIDRFSGILKNLFLPLSLLAIPLSASPADSDFFSPENDLTKVVAVTAPPVSLPLLNANSSSDRHDVKQVTLVHFWASWCVPCREEFPALQRLHDDYKQKGLSIVAIAADNHKAVNRYVIQHDINLPVMIDQYGKAMFDYKVKVLPSSYLVDRDGMIRYMANGHVRWDNLETRKKLDQLIKN